MTLSLAEVGSRKRSLLESSLGRYCREQVPSGPEWLTAHRSAALEWLDNNGMPSTRDEAWKNASIAALLDETVGQPAARTSSHDWQHRTEHGPSPILWLVNGVASSDATAIPGVRWLPMKDALKQDERVSKHLGHHARLENGFVAANCAGFSDGWCLVVEPGVAIDGAIELRLTESAELRGALSLPRLLVIAGAGSQLRLVERHLSPSGETILSNVVAEIVVESGAKIEHSRWVDHGRNTWAMATTAVSVAQDAQYRSWSAVGRGRFVRHDLCVRLMGRHATAVLDGLYYARQGELVAQHTRVWHEAREGTTKECYRGVIENQGRGIFDGVIYVGRGAMQTDARQENQNLLLGPEAVAHTKPQLEIDADDVTCSHGATVGQLDAEQLFYLRARGIAQSEAREMLTWAFANEIVERCPNAQLRSDVEQRLRAHDALEPSAGSERAR
jgi:Fe-S cluster assembly protein SufD